MRHSTTGHSPVGMNAALSNLNQVSQQLSGELDGYKDALTRLQNSAFVSKMRALQSNIL